MTSAAEAKIHRDHTPKIPRMRAFHHAVSGQHMLLQDTELETYTALTTALNAEHNPQTESERQLVQHIIDCHTRINRLTAIENNILEIGLMDQLAEGHRTPGESMLAQSRAWLAQSDQLEKISRCEARLARQLALYTNELARAQKSRSQTTQTKPLTKETASFRTQPATPANPTPKTHNSIPENRKEPEPQAPRSASDITSGVDATRKAA
jgi:hypothetical protein